jgi:hypothetical protein
MTEKKSNTTNEKTRTFTPNMRNFITSSRYEGLSYKSNTSAKNLDDLKLKYAR